MLAVFAGYQVVVLHSGWRGPVDALIGLSYAANFIAPHLISPGLRHLWSLAIEEQFYVVWPIALIALMTRLRWRSLTWCLMVSAFAIAVLAYVGRPYLGAWTEIYVYLEPILLGCAVATARASGRAHVSGRQVSVALGLLIPTLLFYGTGTAYLLVLTFGACAATLMRGVLEHPNGLAARALSNRRLGVIGRTSYGTYLWHYPLLALTGQNVAPTLLLTAVAVTVSYRFIEQPLLHRTNPLQRLTLNTTLPRLSRPIFAIRDR